MAKSTCNPDREAPKGMKKFEVINMVVKDSVGQYCEPGDFGIFDKKAAKVYLDQNMIRVALPDFDEDVADADDSTADDGDAKDDGERAETEAAPVASTRKRATRSATKRD